MFLHAAKGETPAWVASPVGDSAAKPRPGLVAMADQKFTVTPGVGESFPVRDGGTFVHVPVKQPDFDFVARIANVPQDRGHLKIGLMARVSNDGTAPSLALRWDGFKDNQCVQWLYRFAPGESRLQSCRWGYERKAPAPDNLWLRLQRIYPEIRMYYSTDGKEWQRIAEDRYLAFFEQDMLVGLHVTAAQVADAAVTFDQVSLTTAERTGQSQKELFPTLHVQTTSTIYGADYRQSPSAAPERIAIAIPDGVEKLQGILLSGDSGNRGHVRDVNVKKGVPAGALWNKHYRFAAANIARPYEKAEEQIKLLAEVTGRPELANLPFLPMGYSAGSVIASTTWTIPDRTICAVYGGEGRGPGENTNRTVPVLRVEGERDGPHAVRLQGYAQSLQAGVPMTMAVQWDLPHAWAKTNNLAYTFMDAMIAHRLPPGFDPGKARPTLVPLSAKDGLLGRIDQWKSSAIPEVVAYDEKLMASGNYAWLPNKRVARAWQAFSVYMPETAILFPTHRGKEHAHTVDHVLPANKPFTLLATGPVGANIKVEFYADLKRLERLDDGSKPYAATIAGLPPGLHSLYAVTTTEKGEQLSRPNPILFLGE